MRKFLKVVCVSLVCFSLFFGATALLKKPNDVVHRSERKKLFSQPDRASSAYRGIRKNSIRKSIGSAVRIISPTEDESATSLATGTYFTYKGKHYVLTVAHAILGPCKNLLIVYFEHTASCLEFTLVDLRMDYAIIEIEEIEDRVPVRMPQSLQLDKYPKILDKTYYTGYPNSAGPLTITGTIAGFTDDGLIFLQSYAWTGSSGSGVFDHQGNLIGIIMALDIGVTQHGVDVMEDLLIVVPINEIDWSSILH